MGPDLPLPRARYLERLAWLAGHLREQDLDAALVVGPEAQFWLCGYDSYLGSVIAQALVVTAAPSPPTIVVWDADVAIAHQTSLVEDVRTFRFGVDDPVAVFRATVEARVPRLRRLGVDLGSAALSDGTGQALRAALDGIDLVDLHLDLARARAIKSAAELDLMTRAGGFADRGLEAARRCAQAGITEIALAAEIEYAMRRAGSDYWAIPTELASGPRSVQGHGTPTGRVLEPGDLVHVEIGGVAHRYHAIGMGTFVVPGAPPRREAAELYELALRCLRSGLAQLRPGVPAPEVEGPALELIRQSGRGDNFKMRFGYGVGIGYPPSWLEPLKITRTSTDVIVPGMTFVLHACLIDDAAEAGILVGGTYAMLDDGPRMLAGFGDVPLER
ncbi:M24 family metallopeptidase [Alsobacter sp. R-9]